MREGSSLLKAEVGWAQNIALDYSYIDVQGLNWITSKLTTTNFSWFPLASILPGLPNATLGLVAVMAWHHIIGIQLILYLGQSCDEAWDQMILVKSKMSIIELSGINYGSSNCMFTLNVHIAAILLKLQSLSSPTNNPTSASLVVSASVSPAPVHHLFPICHEQSLIYLP